MRVTLERREPGSIVLNTPNFAQVWKGRTESGIAIVAYLVVLAAENDADKERLRSELER